MVEIRRGEPEDLRACTNLATELTGLRWGRSVLQAALDRGQLLVARDGQDVVGCLVYRTDWFSCTFVSLVVVKPERRQRGIARALYRAVEAESLSPRLFSSADETDAASIRMHSALGFTPSGYIDNLPRGSRGLLFYKRLLGRGGRHVRPEAD